MVDCAEAKTRRWWSPFQATPRPSHLNRTRPTWTRVSTPSTEPSSPPTVTLASTSISPQSALFQRGCCSKNVLLSDWTACPGSFQCHNNVCVNQTLRCDGWDDCGDHSDEDNCRECTHVLAPQPSRRGVRTKCTCAESTFLFPSAECDASQLKCKNGQCKPAFWRCDGIDDCGDNSDEENCRP